MPNVCVVAYANGEVETIEVDEWPDLTTIQQTVGGLFAKVPTSFQLEFDGTWEDEAGDQETVVYCRDNAMLRGLPVNRTTLANTINRELGENGPLLGDILIVSGNPDFMALED